MPRCRSQLGHIGRTKEETSEFYWRTGARSRLSWSSRDPVHSRQHVIYITVLCDNLLEYRKTPMRPFAKFVAVTLGLSLWVLPLFAAIPCKASLGAASHCAKCCDGMADSAMMAAAENSLAPAPVELTYPPCCQISSGEVSGLAIVQKTERRILPAVTQLNEMAQASDAAPDLRDAARSTPPLPHKSSHQSILCTFRI